MKVLALYLLYVVRFAGLWGPDNSSVRSAKPPKDVRGSVTEEVIPNTFVTLARRNRRRIVRRRTLLLYPLKPRRMWPSQVHLVFVGFAYVFGRFCRQPIHRLAHPAQAENGDHRRDVEATLNFEGGKILYLDCLDAVADSIRNFSVHDRSCPNFLVRLRFSSNSRMAPEPFLTGHQPWPLVLYSVNRLTSL